jgi:hypothetical protein
MHALFYQLKTIFYRTIRLRLSASDRDTIIEDNQQLFNATSEASSLLQRAMMHDIIQLTPPFLYVPRSSQRNVMRVSKIRLTFSL